MLQMFSISDKYYCFKLFFVSKKQKVDYHGLHKNIK